MQHSNESSTAVLDANARESARGVRGPGGDAVWASADVDHFIHLRAGGVSVLLDLRGAKLPAVVHWGEDLGSVDGPEALALAQGNVEPVVSNSLDDPIRLAILPEHGAGWSGRPGLAGSRQGAGWSPLFTVTGIELRSAQAATVSAEPVPLVGAGPARLVLQALDPDAELQLCLELELTPGGLLRMRAALTNLGGRYELQELSLALPVPPRARELLDFAGRWGKERTPQRRELNVGVHLREGRKGRTGADAATVLSAGTPGFGFAAGEVWGLHVGFSGNHRHYAERLFSGAQVLGGGELLLPGEVLLETGQSYQGPWIYASYADGLDAQAGRFHRHLRSRPTHPHSPRPVTINVWEAVYFDHDLDRLKDLADRAAALGVERYVLDDGWFRHRRDDTAGLGDWYVDETVWPDGLSPLVDHVRGLNMEFGLWFEPEMVNLDSDLARAHPDWVMQTGNRLPKPSRNQQVLNLGIPEAYDHVLERICAILAEYPITYIKWDHNRDLVDAGTAPEGNPGVHRQTLATYRMMNQLKERFPGLEIESCSSGGARVDLGILERTDRVWVSDCIDPLDRQQMNRWTQQLLPPELLGSHIASGKSHTTGRLHTLSFRAGTALFGHLGIEWDLATATEAENRELAEWIRLYKDKRALLHSGAVVRMDETDPTLWISGVVAKDQSEALFSLAYMGRSEVSPRGRFTLRGLDPDLHYRVRPVLIGDANAGFHVPAWFGAQPGAVRPGSIPPGTIQAGVVVSGRSLAAVGLQAPASYPEQVILLDVQAVS